MLLLVTVAAKGFGASAAKTFETRLSRRDSALLSPLDDEVTPMFQAIEANKGNVLLTVRTRKGAFLLSSDATRKDWSVSKPHQAGSDVFHMAYDDREVGTVFVAINSPIWGLRFSGAMISARRGRSRRRIRNSLKTSDLPPFVSGQA